MLSTASDNTPSLSLALDARLAIKALNSYRANGERGTELRESISSAIASLNALRSGECLFDNIAVSSPYESYAQIETLREVQNQFADDQLPEKLGAALESTDMDVRERNIAVAIRFFTALEIRALKKYNQSFGYAR